MQQRKLTRTANFHWVERGVSAVVLLWRVYKSPSLSRFTAQSEVLNVFFSVGQKAICSFKSV